LKIINYKTVSKLDERGEEGEKEGGKERTNIVEETEVAGPKSFPRRKWPMRSSLFITIDII